MDNERANGSGPDDQDDDLRETSTRTRDGAIPSSYGEAGGMLPEGEEAQR